MVVTVDRPDFDDCPQESQGSRRRRRKDPRQFRHRQANLRHREANPRHRLANLRRHSLANLRRRRLANLRRRRGNLRHHGLGRI